MKFENLSIEMQTYINEKLEQFVDDKINENSNLSYLKMPLHHLRLRYIKDYLDQCDEDCDITEQKIHDLIYASSCDVYPKQYKNIIEIDKITKYKMEQKSMITTKKCRKCKVSRGSIFQMQTRSADEPMTTFYKCANCNLTIRQ